MLRFRSCSCVLIVLLAFANAVAQTDDGQQKLKYVIVPHDNTLLLVASQPECPLQIERAKLLISTEKNHDVIFQYDLRNTGNKPIRGFNVVFFSSEGNGGTLTDDRLKDKMLLPGQIILSKEESTTRTVLPLTSELRKSLKLDAPVRTFVVLMIWTVDFNDGSVFSDEKNLRATRAFFEELDMPQK